MSLSAVCLETVSVIDVESLLAQHTEEWMRINLSSKRYGCIHCLRALDRRRTGLERSDEEILKGIDPASLPQDKYFRNGTTYEKWGETVVALPCFCHLPGLGDRVKCDSPESRHHSFCKELANGKRNLLFPSGDPANLVRTTMARYVKEPAHREPDVAFLVAETPALAASLQSEIDRGGHRTLDFDGYKGLLAVEVQLSKLSVAEYQERTRDHRRLFQDVMWVFHERFLANTKNVRAYMDQVGDVAWVIREQDSSFFIEEHHYKPRKRESTKSRRPDFCPDALLLIAEMQVSTWGGSMEQARALADEWASALARGESVQPLICGGAG